MRIASLAILLPAAGVLACHPAITPQGNEPLDFNTSAFAAPAETVRLPAEETRLVYDAVLRFYRPGPGRARWLDPVLLPANPAGHDSLVFDSDLAESMTEQLGSSFCVLTERRECRGMSAGGTLRVSPVYQVDGEHARVVVQFIGQEPYGTEVTNFQVFLLARDGGKWKIRSRGPVKAAES